MKKILTSVLASLFVLSNLTIADTTNIGAKISNGKLKATGTETTNDSGTISNSGDARFTYGSLFVERELSFSLANVTLGLDYVPMNAEVDKITGGTGTDATIKMSNHKTLYIQPSKSLDNGVSIFAKVGYSHADLKVTDITRQTSYNSSGATDTSASKSLKGPVYGIGVQKSFSNGVFLRADYTKTNYSEISYTNSNSKVLKADPDLSAINISLGKKF